MTDSEEKVPASDAAFLELYKLAVEMADRISARRAAANSFFFAVHAALVALIGFVRPSKGSSPTGQTVRQAGDTVDAFGTIYVAVGGLVLALAWWLLLRSFRDLNRAKFKVILEMEEKLPVGPFGAEWKYLKADPIKSWRQRYAEFGTVERLVPAVFAAIYVAAIVRFAA